jgi:hypothetical protein
MKNDLARRNSCGYTAGMKHIIATIILCALLTPALAAADSTYGVQPTLGQLLARLAYLQATLEKKAIACAMTTAPQTVTAGVPFTLAWGSFGADPSFAPSGISAWNNNGEQKILIETPGKRKYTFDFYGSSGKTTCTLIIDVKAKQ